MDPLLRAMAAISLLLGTAAAAQRIDFDRNPDGVAISGGTPVNSTYASSGVSFEWVGDSRPCGSGSDVYANSSRPAGFGSPPNVVSVCATGAPHFDEATFGLVRAIFDEPTWQVCIDVHPEGASDWAVLRSFADSQGRQPLGAVFSRAGEIETLCIVEDEDTKSIEFAGWEFRGAAFDNLQVPEPPSDLLRVAALLAVGVSCACAAPRWNPPRRRPPPPALDPSVM